MADADWLAAIAAAPDDPMVRLAYADWLDDRGDRRGELVRIDVELARLSDGDPATVPMRSRLAELVPGTDARWRAAVCRVPASDPPAEAWYVRAACDCERPEAVAPELFTPAVFSRHVLHRPPAGRAEIARLCAAAQACATSAVRYQGTDPVVIHLLGNTADLTDHIVSPDAPEPVHVGLSAHQQAVAAAAAGYTGEAPPATIGEAVWRLVRIVLLDR